MKNPVILLGLAAAFAASVSRAANIDMGGATDETDDLATYAWNGTAIKNNTLINGVLNVTGYQQFVSGTFIFGRGLVLNQTDEQWGVSSARSVCFVDGGRLNYTTTGDIYFGRCYDNGAWRTYNGTTQLILKRNGVVDAPAAAIRFSPKSITPDLTRTPVLNLTLIGGSSLTARVMRFGMAEANNGCMVTTMKATLAVTNSTLAMTDDGILFGNPVNKLQDLDNSLITASFGPGADITCKNLFVYQYPKTVISFDGATLHTLSSKTSASLFGRHADAKETFAGFHLLSGGLTFDLDYDMTHNSSFAPFFGPGGFVKTGSGCLTYNQDAFLFTGALTVSNGTFVSNQKMAASAFNVDGASSVLQLSGALTNATVALSATAGGRLTLAGATLADAAPSLTLADGGTTDYFTRDGVVGAYALDSLTLGPGAVLDLDADATGIDAIDAATTTVTATEQEPVTLNIAFRAVPATGSSFTLFKADDAKPFTVVATCGDREILTAVSVVKGSLVLTVTSAGTVITIR